MDVAVSELRAHLAAYLEQARDGTDVVVTDRGVPIARLTATDATHTIERLLRKGVIGRAASPQRPVLAGRARPRPKRSVADRVSDQRD